MTLDELTTPLTKDEVSAAIYAALAAKGANTTSWKSGSVVRTVIAGVSIVLAAFSKLNAAVAKSGFLEYAEGDWLTLVASKVYGVDRDLGSFATGVVTFTNAGGGTFDYGPDEIVLVNTTTGARYRNTGFVFIGGLATVSNVPIQAVEIGTGSNASVGEVDDLETTLLGVTVTNPSSIVGSDAEDDAALKLRCRAKTGAASPNGPRDVYSYLARSAKRADGTSIGVTRVMSVADGDGNVDVYVADGDGPISGSAGDTSTDLGIIANLMETKAAPLAVNVTTASATALAINVTYSLWVWNTSGFSDEQIEEKVEALLLAYLAKQPIGGILRPGDTLKRVYKDAIESVIGGVLPGLIIDLEVTVPPGDTTVSSTQAPVLGTVTPTVVQVAVGET